MYLFSRLSGLEPYNKQNAQSMPGTPYSWEIFKERKKSKRDGWK